MGTLKNVTTSAETEEQNTQATEQQQEKMVGSIPANSAFEFEPTPFESFGNITRITNKELCEIIKAKFGATFHDLRGVMIHFVNGQWITEMYFEENADQIKPGQIKNLVSLTTGNTKNDKSFLPGQQRIYSKLNGKLYTINDETKLLLSDFMYGGRKANNVNDRKKWDQNIHPIDIGMRAGYGQHPFYPTNAHQVFIQVTGLDLRKLLRDAVFGPSMVTKTVTNGDGTMGNVVSKAFYEPRYIKPLPGVNEVFVMNIEQFDKDAVEKYVAIENPMVYAAPNGVRFF
jgi:hypothetical protein